jgi:hypothetical protein
MDEREFIDEEPRLGDQAVLDAPLADFEHADRPAGGRDPVNGAQVRSLDQPGGPDAAAVHDVVEHAVAAIGDRGAVETQAGVGIQRGERRHSDAAWPEAVHRVLAPLSERNRPEAQHQFEVGPLLVGEGGVGERPPDGRAVLVARHLRSP